VDLLDQIAEARIREAVEAGELSHLPGEGKPVELEDDSLIPEHLRVAYRILKNSGFLPPELQLRKDIQEAEQLLMTIEDSAERSRAQLRLQLLRTRLNATRQQPFNLQIEEVYYQRLIEKMERNR
jgi:hypothetical protein